MIKTYIPVILKALEKASEKIMEIYAQDFEVEIKADDSPVTIADKASSKILMDALSVFNIPIISEEEEKPKYDNRKNEKLIWLVDPLDGTKEFIAKNNQFCICVALVESGEPILGFIASPVTKQILFGGKSIGAFDIPFKTTDIYNKKWQIKTCKPNKIKVLAHSNSPFSETSRKFVHNLKKQFGPIHIIKKGSALKLVDLVTGKADFYIRLAPTMEWDIAAGQAIYNAVGGEVVDFYDKTELYYNKQELRNPHFLAKLKSIKLDNNE